MIEFNVVQIPPTATSTENNAFYICLYLVSIHTFLSKSTLRVYSMFSMFVIA